MLILVYPPNTKSRGFFWPNVLHDNVLDESSSLAKKDSRVQHVSRLHVVPGVGVRRGVAAGPVGGPENLSRAIKVQVYSDVDTLSPFLKNPNISQTLNTWTWLLL